VSPSPSLITLVALLMVAPIIRVGLARFVLSAYREIHHDQNGRTKNEALQKNLGLVEVVLKMPPIIQFIGTNLF
jgi:hypothetical protein